MTSLQSRLADRAAGLSRGIFASLPIEVRVAHLAFELRLGNALAQDAFGRSAYTIFIARGVEGLPDVQPRGHSEAVPALSLRDEVKKNISSWTDRMPKGYGLLFARKLWGTIQNRTRNEALTSDVFFNTISKLLQQPTLIREGVPLRMAEGYLYQMAKNAIIDFRKHERRESPGDVGEITEDLPASFSQTLETLESTLSARELLDVIRKAEPALKKVHPDAPLYLELSLQGYDDAHIVGDPRKNRPSMLPSVSEVGGRTPQWWEYRIKPKIREVLVEHL
jgi:hypothetical protein